MDSNRKEGPAANDAGQSTGSAWAVAGLVLTLIFAVWWRGHTFGPTIEDLIGVAPWPVVKGETEPLDCDEAAYAYMARRMLEGDRLYADLSENKPPLGYWIYTLAVAIGGPDELSIRVLPIPFVLATVGLVWWVGLRLGGPLASVVAALLCVLLSTDPYLYGNGAQLEQMMNCFAVAGLAAVLRAREATRRPGAWIVLAGVAIGLATLVKQVAALHLVVLGAAVLAMPRRADGGATAGRLREFGALVAGFGGILAITLLVLVARGVASEAFDDIIRAGGALAADVEPEPNAPPGSVRWLTGNADPAGVLPPPFGRTNYLVWWGGGSWPIWLVAVPCLIGLAIARPAWGRLVLVGWTISALVQVVAPGLYWAHYYLLPVPGLALAVGVAFGDLVMGERRRKGSWLVGLILLAAMAGFAAIQVRDYLMLPPEELTIRHKGGRQWVELRKMGRSLGEQAAGRRESPRLFVWGWQSPLHFYSGMDAPTRHFFTNNLMRDYADRPHPVVSPRIAELMEDLRREPPELVLVAYPPFPALLEFLEGNYLSGSSDGRGLWVRKDRLAGMRAEP